MKSIKLAQDERENLHHSATYQLKCLTKKQQKQTLQRLKHQASPKFARSTITAPSRMRLRPLSSVSTTDEETLELKELRYQKNAGPITTQLIVDAMVEAAGIGDIRKVKRFLKESVPINQKHSVLGCTALHAAAATRNPATLDVLIQSGADVHIIDNESNSALHIAAKHGHINAVQHLLKAGANREVINKNEETAQGVAFEFRRPVAACMLYPPADPPYGVICTSVTSTMIEIEWKAREFEETLNELFDDPREPQRKAAAVRDETLFTKYYKIEFSIHADKPPASVMSSVRHVKLQGLLPATDYRIQILAANEGGWGEPSELHIFRTADDIPNVPVPPQITEVSDCTAIMMFRYPRSNGSPVTHFSLQTQCKGSISSPHIRFTNFTDATHDDDSWTTLWAGEAIFLDTWSEDENVRLYKAQGLNPGHIYFFRVRAKNDIGWSDYSISSTGICTNDSPRMVDHTAFSISLVWTKPFSDSKILNYELQARDLSSTSTWRTVYKAVVGQTGTVNGLQPSTGYKFRVRPNSEQNEWKTFDACAISDTFYTKVATPNPPENLTLLDRKRYDIRVGWDIARCNGSMVSQYELTYRPMDLTVSDDGMVKALVNESNEWSVISNLMGASKTSVWIRDLEKGVPYQVRLRAKNLIGWSDYRISETPFWTHAIIPPSKPTVISRTRHSLKIGWTLESTPDTENKYFEVQLVAFEGMDKPTAKQKKDATQWQTVCEQCLEREFDCLGLTALKWYVFRVRGYVENHGWGTYSAPTDAIQTLRRM